MYNMETEMNVPADQQVVEINITNICVVTPTDLAIYISRRMLNVYVPVASPNQPLIVTAANATLLGDVSNRLSFATEMWTMIRAELGKWKKAKKRADKESKLQIEDTIEDLNAKLEILYRVIQALNNKYEAISRQNTILTNKH